jgi:hypothetical protein
LFEPTKSSSLFFLRCLHSLVIFNLPMFVCYGRPLLSSFAVVHRLFSPFGLSSDDIALGPIDSSTVVSPFAAAQAAAQALAQAPPLPDFLDVQPPANPAANNGPVDFLDEF